MQQIDLNNTNYTNEKLKGNFEVRFIKLDKLIPELISNYEKHIESKNIALEMIPVIEELKFKNIKL